MISLRISALALVLVYATNTVPMPASAPGEWSTSRLPESPTADKMAHIFSSQSAKSTQDWDVLKPPKGAGGLAGLYWGSMMQNSLSAFGGMTMQVTRSYAVFFPNGQFFDGLPFGGRISDLDFAEAAKMFPKLCGIYRLQGNNIIFKLLSSSNQIVERVIPFRRIDANHIEFYEGSIQMLRAEPAHDLHLNGLYTASNLVSAGDANVNSATFIEFSPDGRYRQSGFTSVDSPGGGNLGETRRVSTAKRGPQTGRYKIEEFRLTLTPDNGPTQSFTIVLTDTSPATNSLFINNVAFLKR